MKITLKTVIGLGVGLFVIWISSFFIVKQFYSEISESAAFGDTFGAINSLFTGLAFLGVIITIIMQSEELKIQREELKMTRNELKKSADAQNEQVKIQINLAKLNAYGTLLSRVDQSKTYYVLDSQPIEKKINTIISELEE